MRRTLAILGLLMIIASGCARKETDITEAAPSTTMPPTPAELAAATPADATTAAPPVAADTASTATSTATAEKKPVPKTHTVDHGGIMHAAGSDQPAQKCASCHGPDLRGGKVASSSCYDCHEKTWQ